MTNPLRHYKKFLRKNGYAIPPDDRDVVYRVRAIMKVRFPCGWRESFLASGGVILHSPKQEKQQ